MSSQIMKSNAAAAGLPCRKFGKQARNACKLEVLHKMKTN